MNSDYGGDVTLMARYMNIMGMFEAKDNGTYQMYYNINKDEFTWKKYSHNIRKNNHENLEMVVDLTDVNLQGTKDAPYPMKEVINRFQVRIDDKLII